MSIYGRIKHDDEGVMTYYVYEAHLPLPKTLAFDWEGTEGYVGGPYIDIRWIDEDGSRATINTMQNGRKIDFTEDNFRLEIEEWLEHNLADFIEDRRN